MTTTAPALEVVEHTLAEYERIAIGTGAWNGAEAPEFSNDGVIWSDAWLPTEAFPYPLLARATAYRHGVDRPTVVVVRWDESVPAIDGWRELWLRKPTALFGAFARRAAIRSAFRDVLGDRREPDEVDPPAPPAPRPAANSESWVSRIKAATTPEEVVALHADARRAREVTVFIERTIRLRLKELASAEAEGSPSTVVDHETGEGVASGTTAPSPQNFPKPTPPKVRLEDTVRKPQPRRRKK